MTSSPVTSSHVVTHNSHSLRSDRRRCRCPPPRGSLLRSHRQLGRSGDNSRAARQQTQGLARKLHLYLSYWTGGPQTYVERNGHPRLRARHLPFTIGAANATNGSGPWTARSMNTTCQTSSALNSASDSIRSPITCAIGRTNSSRSLHPFHKAHERVAFCDHGRLGPKSWMNNAPRGVSTIAERSACPVRTESAEPAPTPRRYVPRYSAIVIGKAPDESESPFRERANRRASRTGPAIGRGSPRCFHRACRRKSRPPLRRCSPSRRPGTVNIARRAVDIGGRDTHFAGTVVW